MKCLATLLGGRLPHTHALCACFYCFSASLFSLPLTDKVQDRLRALDHLLPLHAARLKDFVEGAVLHTLLSNDQAYLKHAKVFKNGNTYAIPCQ